MMLTIPVGLLLVHFVGDFLLQSNWMALNKSKNLLALIFHVLVYSACFLPFGWRFALATFWLHFVTDFFTSRLTSKLWFIDMSPASKIIQNTPLKEYTFFGKFNDTKRHWFFVAVGLDQLIHAITLALTWRFLVS